AFGTRGTYNPANPECRVSRLASHADSHCRFPKAQGAILMKKILVTVVLGVAALAAAQDAAKPAQGQPSASPAQSAAQPAQGQPPASQAQAPVIKDPAEYNAYVAAIGQKDPAAQISGLEAFLTQYPNSIMKPQALDVLMGLYQQTGNPKVMDAAKRVLAVNPDSVKALVVLAFS